MRQRHNAVMGLNQMNRGALLLSQPSCELFRAVQSGRQHHHLDGGRKKDHGLFPYRPTVLIIDVVTFIKDNGVHILHRERGGQTQMLRGGAFFVKEISQNFSGHDHDLRIRTELDVSRHDAHRGVVELFF